MLDVHFYRDLVDAHIPAISLLLLPSIKWSRMRLFCSVKPASDKLVERAFVAHRSHSQLQQAFADVDLAARSLGSCHIRSFGSKPLRAWNSKAVETDSTSNIFTRHLRTEKNSLNMHIKYIFIFK